MVNEACMNEEHAKRIESEKRGRGSCMRRHAQLGNALRMDGDAESRTEL